MPKPVPGSVEMTQYRDNLSRDLRAAVELVNSGIKEAQEAGLIVQVDVVYSSADRPQISWINVATRNPL